MDAGMRLVLQECRKSGPYGRAVERTITGDSG